MVGNVGKGLLSLVAGLAVAVGVQNTKIPDYYLRENAKDITQRANSGDRFQELAAKVEYFGSKYGCGIGAMFLFGIGCYAFLDRRRKD